MRAAFVPALLLAAFTSGLFFTGYRDIIYAPAVLFVMLAFCAAAVPCFMRGCNLPSGAVPLLLFALWLYVTLSLTWSSVPFASLVTWLVFICLPLTFFTLSLPPDNRPFIVAAAGVLLSALALLGGWAFVQGVFLRGIFGARAHYPLLNANDLAALLSLGLFPVLAYLLHVRERGRMFYAAAAVALLIFGGLLATQSRSGLLFALLAAGLLCAMLRPAWKRAAAAGGAGLALFVLMQLENGWRLAARMVELAAPASDPNVVSRLSLWKSTIHMIADHPWSGTGLGTFYLYYPRYRAPLVENSAGFWAHNDFLQLGAETGVAAAALLVALCAAIAWRTFRVMRGLAPESPRRAALAGFSCALMTLALHAQTGFPIYILPVLVVAGAWLAAWQHLAGDYASLDIAPWQRPVLSGCVIAVAGMIALLAASSAAGQYYLSRATDGIRQGSVTVFADNIERAELFASRSFIDPEVHLAGLYIDTIGGAGILFPADDREKMFEETQALLNAAEAMNPAWAEIDYKRGKLYVAVKDNESAAASWRKALAKNPQHDRARLALAQVLVSAGRPAAALDLLARGLQYPVDRDVAIQYRALIKQMEGPAVLQKKFMMETDVPQ